MRCFLSVLNPCRSVAADAKAHEVKNFTAAATPLRPPIAIGRSGSNFPGKMQIFDLGGGQLADGGHLTSADRMAFWPIAGPVAGRTRERNSLSKFSISNLKQERRI